VKKLNIRNIVLFVLGCLIVGIFVNFIIVRNIFALQGLVYIIITVLSVIMCGLVIYLFTFLIIKENKQKIPGNGFGTISSDSEQVKKLIAKISEHLVKIKQLNAYISDKNISDELSETEKNIYKIQNQLKDETVSVKRINQLEEFFEYYMPLIVKILNSYKRIETNELTGKNATETKNQVSAILPLIKKAFEKELDYMFTDEMLDITTDIKVLESMMAKDGLIDILNKNNNI